MLLGRVVISLKNRSKQKGVFMLILLLLSCSYVSMASDLGKTALMVPRSVFSQDEINFFLRMTHLGVDCNNEFYERDDIPADQYKLLIDQRTLEYKVHQALYFAVITYNIQPQNKYKIDFPSLASLGISSVMDGSLEPEDVISQLERSDAQLYKAQKDHNKYLKSLVKKLRAVNKGVVPVGFQSKKDIAYLASHWFQTEGAALHSLEMFHNKCKLHENSYLKIQEELKLLYAAKKKTVDLSRYNTLREIAPSLLDHQKQDVYLALLHDDMPKKNRFILPPIESPVHEKIK